MNIYIFSEEERQYLKGNINDVILIFCESHMELKKKLKKNEKKTEQLFQNDYYRKETFLKESSYAFSSGYCFYFARIMKKVFPDFKYYFNEYGIHVIIGDGNLFFDINGVVDIFSQELDMYIYFLATTENLQKAKKEFPYLDDEIYEELKSIFYNKLREYLNGHIGKGKKYKEKHN